MDIRKRIGQNGETEAASFLERNGVRILNRNYRCRFGEIDLIGRTSQYLLIVEVKTRTGQEQGMPCESVNYRKQRKICQTFNYYRMKEHIDDYTPVRFDVIEVDGNMKCNWIKNAFEYIE